MQKLYKQTSSGAIQEWEVSVIHNNVVTRFGQLNSPNIQETSEIVKGKNIGKTNETSDVEQAQLRAEQMHSAKIKKGYTPDLELAKSTKNTLDAVNPMLAYPIEKKEKHVEFPAYAQPKLDGMRCIAVVTDFKCTLYTRTQKIIPTIPHINKQIEVASIALGLPDMVLDGELYNHDLKDDFNRLMSLIKRDEPHEDCKVVEYHMYDDVSEFSEYEDRYETIKDVSTYGSHLIATKSYLVEDRKQLDQYFHAFLSQGYEGAMYRNPKVGYEQKRSTSLLKVKVMDDREFEIVDVNEGKGKLAGKAGAFVCRIAYVDCSQNQPMGGGKTEYKEFKAKLKGNIDDLEEYWVNKDKYIGKQLTVQYQGLTPDGIPRFPVGLRIRIEE